MRPLRWVLLHTGGLIYLAFAPFTHAADLASDPVPHLAQDVVQNNATLQQQAPQSWQQTIDKVALGVVSIRVDHTRAFDENWNQSTQATGFVVDRARGIILTNRHVIGPGPSTARAIFFNQEEVNLTPIYRDPIHDFGFFRYNPADLQHIEPTELKLDEKAAKVGVEIRVIGNDAGEQLSILDGTIARLDRQAPGYGRGKYNDFNTFYFQAASGTSGGSSGSPVVNQQGQVVALNAGARSGGATSYFLPLPQVVRTLSFLQKDLTAPRGSLQTTFVHKPYAELEKLGLTKRTETNFRGEFANSRGLLVVEHTLLDNSLQVGDILVSINRRLIPEFYSLEAMLDRQVGENINIVVERAGKVIKINTPVHDLHKITPTEYVEFDGAILHNLSYQRARHLNIPIKGVFVADPGYGLGQGAVPKNALITEFAGKPVNNLDELVTQIEQSTPGQDVSVRFITLASSRVEEFTSVKLDSIWFPANRCDLGEEEGIWQCKPLSMQTLDKQTKDKQTTATTTSPETVAATDEYRHSLVHLRLKVPYPVSGHKAGQSTGTGIVIDAERGWVLASRTDIPTSMGDVYLTFNAEVEIPGKVLHLHPTHNLAIVAYDPKLVTSTPVTQVNFSDAELHLGQPYAIVGLGREQKLRQQIATFTEVEPVQFPVSAPPRFQSKNTELLQFINGPTDFTGWIADKDKNIVGLWLQFKHLSNNRPRSWHRGVHLDIAKKFIARAKRKQEWLDLGTSWFPVTLATGRKLGLAPAEITKLRNAGISQLYELQRISHSGAANEKLLRGDILLDINGKPVNSLREIDILTLSDAVEVRILRNREVINVAVDAESHPTTDIQRAVYWAGALIQPPPATLAQERQLPLDGVYVSFYKYGSPASRAGLVASMRIIEFDEVAVNNIKTFVRMAKKKQNSATVRLRVLDLNEQEHLITLRQDNIYWPPYQLLAKEGTWQRSKL